VSSARQRSVLLKWRKVKCWQLIRLRGFFGHQCTGHTHCGISPPTPTAIRRESPERLPSGACRVVREYRGHREAVQGAGAGWPAHTCRGPRRTEGQGEAQAVPTQLCVERAFCGETDIFVGQLAGALEQANALIKGRGPASCKVPVVTPPENKPPFLIFGRSDCQTQRLLIGGGVKEGMAATVPF
jgi:hypothetical protein